MKFGTIEIWGGVVLGSALRVVRLALGPVAEAGSHFTISADISFSPKTWLPIVTPRVAIKLVFVDST